MQAPRRRSQVRWSNPALAGVAIFVLSALAGCNDSEPGPTSETADSRVDSAARFGGERRVIATTLEAFEQAVLANDVERICRRYLHVRESRDPDNDNGGRRFCAADPANDPARQIRRAGGDERYDLVVRRIELGPRRRVGAHGPTRRAAARVEIGPHRETFMLGKRRLGWDVTARSFAEPALEPGRYDSAPGCDSGVSISVFAGQPEARLPRKAVTRGPFGDGVRRALSHGGSLSLAGVEYSPDYRHTYLLRNASGRVERGFPVTVYRYDSFDASEALICSERDAARWRTAGGRP
jgi:hypothetical protein